MDRGVSPLSDGAEGEMPRADDSRGRRSSVASASKLCIVKLARMGYSCARLFEGWTLNAAFVP